MLATAPLSVSGSLNGRPPKYQTSSQESKVKLPVVSSGNVGLQPSTVSDLPVILHTIAM